MALDFDFGAPGVCVLRDAETGAVIERREFPTLAEAVRYAEGVDMARLEESEEQAVCALVRRS